MKKKISKEIRVKCSGVNNVSDDYVNINTITIMSAWIMLALITIMIGSHLLSDTV